MRTQQSPGEQGIPVAAAQTSIPAGVTPQDPQDARVWLKLLGAAQHIQGGMMLRTCMRCGAPHWQDVDRGYRASVMEDDNKFYDFGYSTSKTNARAFADMLSKAGLLAVTRELR